MDKEEGTSREADSPVSLEIIRFLHVILPENLADFTKCFSIHFSV